jgi:tetratricopeptide (TPR) repeat protein
MGVDARRDHSFRVPRPDLSVRLGTPNACTRCHTDEPAEWAVEQLQKTRGKTPRGFQTYADALHAARVGHPAAERLLTGVVRDAATPGIARATALWELGHAPGPSTPAVVEQGVADADPLVRGAAAAALEALPPAERLRLGLRLVDDPLRAIRLEAAWALADVPQGTLAESQRERLKRALQEYVQAQEANAERPESQVNLGTLHVRQGRFAEAEAAYRKAITLQPFFVGAYVNLADLYRLTNRDGDGEQVLRAGIAAVPESADLHHALGLLLVRQRRYDQALEALAQAVRLAPDNARYAAVYAIALSDLGQPDAALAALQAAHERQPHNAQLLLRLVQFHRQAGRLAPALRYAETLAQLDPLNASLQNLVRQLKAGLAPGAR